MKKKIMSFFLLGILVIFLGCTQTTQINKESIKYALDTAIDDEYKAYATYDAILQKFGDIAPFSNIIKAEQQHINALKSLYEKYGLEIPENHYLGNVSVPDTIQECCQMGVEAEIANAALYKDKLIPLVKDYPDIVEVFTALMNASQNNHLKAFQACAS